MSLSLILVLVGLQVAIFVWLIHVLRRMFSKNVVSATKHLEDLGHDFDQKQEEIKKKAEDAEKFYNDKIAKAEEEANKVRVQLLKQAHDERDRLIEQARIQGQEIVQQADKASQALLAESKEMIAKEAIRYAQELISAALPEQLRRAAHSRWITDLVNSGFSQLDAAQIPKDINQVEISSAFALDEEQRRIIQDKLNEKLSRQVALVEDVNLELVAGIVVTAGSLVLDGSLRYKIQEEAKKLSSV